MSCSKKSTIDYLVRRNLIKPNMELYSNLPTERLSKTIDRLTKIAKDKYGVDMGRLFKVKFKDIQVGSYVMLGRSSIVTKARLEANDAAFDAIDRSEQQSINEQIYIRESTRTRVDIESDYLNIQEEGNFVVNEDGDISVPPNMPKINIKC